METSTATNIDVAAVAKNLDLEADKVSSAIRLLESGNTIPFITRYRKDETGGLVEKQLRDIKKEVVRLTALAERKSFVLKAIENQGKLTDPLRQQIERANQSRQVEDLYHPFKPRKTSLAETARQQGLEPLARDILEGHQPDIDLASRATDFVRVDKGLNSVDEVITGVKHILAERFCEHLQLRTQLRKLYWETGKVKTELVAAPAEPAAKENAAKENAPNKSEPAATDAPAEGTAAKPADAAAKESSAPETNAPQTNAPETIGTDAVNETEQQQPEPVKEPAAPTGEQTAASTDAAATSGSTESTPPTSTPAETAAATETNATETTATETTAAALPADPSATATATATTTAAPPKKKRKKKKKKKKSRPEPFAEFANFEESLQKLPPHRTLAINRGEKANKLKTRLSADDQRLIEIAKANLVPEDHPFAEFLTSVSEDAMQRLIIPSIERELRRDLTERAESHAVSVFARNLRHLFLQPPVRGQRIMGIDPGYRSGCKVAVIDETGQPLGHGVFSIVGNAERIKNNQQRLKDLITEHQPQLIAIGNGSGCRAVEQFVSDVISGDLADQQIRYSIVNQAGTSGYSTSELGEQELPNHDPVIRSAISIARRLQDPLSELVKVNPANVGVGLYQHDIKAKHLADSLENVVESCVNYVGVNANTASPALLKYISGVGQTTARKLVEHRNEKGVFNGRNELREVSGFGDVTFVQAAGFLRIQRSENPLDRTSIHPEEYEIANKILSKLNCTIDDLTPVRLPRRPVAPPAQPASEAEATKVTDEKPIVENKAADSQATDASASEKSADESTENAATAEAQQSTTEAAPAESPASEESPATPATTAAETDSATPESPAETAPTPESNPPASETVAAPATAPAVVVQEAPPTPVLSPVMVKQKRERRKELVQQLKSMNASELAKEFGIGEMKMRDLLRSLRNPSYDPREDLPSPVFRKGILNFDDLKKGMQLRGQIVNVVDFGVFLNIGIGESCLVHISRLANRYVRDPHWFYAVGDVLNVWVQEIDSEKRRVTLTAIRPESQKRERTRKPRSEERSSGNQRGNRGPSPHGGGRGGKKRHSQSRNQSRGKTHQKRPRKPKPVTPITDEMAEGKAPMRSFSDLLQFHQRSTDDPKDAKGKQDSKDGKDSKGKK